jgi:hypothetical protein
MPPFSIFSTTSGELLAGPSVHTILTWRFVAVLVIVNYYNISKYAIMKYEEPGTAPVEFYAMVTRLHDSPESLMGISNGSSPARSLCGGNRAF